MDQSNEPKRAILVRVPESAARRLEELAREEYRPVANLAARILVRAANREQQSREPVMAA